MIALALRPPPQSQHLYSTTSLTRISLPPISVRVRAECEREAAKRREGAQRLRALLERALKLLAAAAVDYADRAGGADPQTLAEKIFHARVAVVEAAYANAPEGALIRAVIDAAEVLRAEQPPPPVKQSSSPRPLSRRTAPVLPAAVTALCRPRDDSGKIIPYAALQKKRRPQLAVGAAVEPERMRRFMADDGKFINVNDVLTKQDSKSHQPEPRGKAESIPSEYFDRTDGRSEKPKISLGRCEGAIFTREAGLWMVDSAATSALPASGRCKSLECDAPIAPVGGSWCVACRGIMLAPPRPWQKLKTATNG